MADKKKKPEPLLTPTKAADKIKKDASSPLLRRLSLFKKYVFILSYSLCSFRSYILQHFRSRIIHPFWSYSATTSNMITISNFATIYSNIIILLIFFVIESTLLYRRKPPTKSAMITSDARPATTAGSRTTLELGQVGNMHPRPFATNASFDH